MYELGVQYYQAVDFAGGDRGYLIFKNLSFAAINRISLKIVFLINSVINREF
jgi:hypothetical protein